MTGRIFCGHVHYNFLLNISWVTSVLQWLRIRNLLAVSERTYERPRSELTLVSALDLESSEI